MSILLIAPNKIPRVIAEKGGAVFEVGGVMPSVAFERVLLCHRPHRAYGHMLNSV